MRRVPYVESVVHSKVVIAVEKSSGFFHPPPRFRVARCLAMVASALTLARRRWPSVNTIRWLRYSARSRSLSCSASRPALINSGSASNFLLTSPPHHNDLPVRYHFLTPVFMRIHRGCIRFYLQRPGPGGVAGRHFQAGMPVPPGSTKTLVSRVCACVF